MLKMLEMFKNEEVFEFMSCNPATRAKLSHAIVYTTSEMDEFVTHRTECAKDLSNLDDGSVLYIEWKDGAFAVYYKKMGGWTIVVVKR